MKSLDVAPDAEPDEVERRARAELAALDDGHGVLVLTDCLGGTPANVAARLSEAGRFEVVAGVNLPMLLRALCYCDAQVDVLAEKAAAGGARGITPVARTPVSHRAGGCSDDDQTRIQDQ
jgi:PTS system ascorbate-specific IIA component